jgi:DNA-binding response OmpR family regulator
MPGRLLAAKLKAHARAAAPRAEAVLWSPSRTLKLDLRRKRAFLRIGGGRWKALSDLTSTEFEILGLLLKGAGGPVERRFILETLWREQALDVRSDSVNKHVQALRRKLNRHGAFVKSLYGVGYAWREE